MTPQRVDDVLVSWCDTATKRAIVDYVARVTTKGEDFVPVDARVATFDNDGTLWCEKPMPVELGFILERLAAMADTDESLREQQPWKAARDRDFAWLSAAIDEHYRGDDRRVKTLLTGVVRAFGGMTVDDYEAAADRYVRDGRHPSLRCGFTRCVYQPMIELLRYLEANGFTTFVTSGGDRDFMRPFVDDVYGIPPERVIGSSNALRYDESTRNLSYLAEPDVFDDGPAKPVRIWSRIGRRPLVAGGNSNGDVPMLSFAGGEHPALRLLVNHDDPDREFGYTTGAESALTRATEEGWTVVSMRHDWSTVFAGSADE